MRFLEDMDRRLQNWARWRALREDGGGGFARGSMEERVDGQGWDAPQVIPTSDAEAEQTQRGVMQLEGAQCAALHCWYLGGGGVAQRARRAGCSETELRTRVGRGQRALSSWLADQAEAARRERERVEKLQRAAADVQR